jgi:hypothetical protein
MPTIRVKQLIDENGYFYPLSHIDAVRDENGCTIRDLISGLGALPFSETVEDGFFVVDENLNIGAVVNTTGVHSKNILSYEIVDY